LLSTLLPLAGTAVLLHLRWRSLPQRFPIHWGIDGQANRWAERTPGSVFGFLVFALVLVLLFGLIGEIVARSSPGYEGRDAAIRTTRVALVGAGWVVTMLVSAIGLLPLSSNPTNLVPLVAVAAIVFSMGLIGFSAWRMNGINQTLIAGQNSTDARFWKAGLVYYNPADSALMVPKRNGLGGYTLNFGRPVSWLLLAVILMLPLILPLLIHQSRRP